MNFLDFPVVQTLVIGMAASSMIEAAKRWDAIPVNSGDDKVINAVVAIVGILSGFVTAAAQHQLSGFDFKTALSVGLPAVTTIGGSLMSYFALIQKAHKPEPAPVVNNAPAVPAPPPGPAQVMPVIKQ